MKAVSNTGPLIHLSWLDRLPLLGQLFDQVLLPAAVYAEAVQARPDARGVKTIQAALAEPWLKVCPVRNMTPMAPLMRFLDRGEAEAILLTREAAADLLLSDDRRARLEASRQGVAFTGTVGLLRMAQDRGLIDLIYPLVLDLRRQGFWLSSDLIERIRREDGQ